VFSHLQRENVDDTWTIMLAIQSRWGPTRPRAPIKDTVNPGVRSCLPNSKEGLLAAARSSTF
jgi:hypothetical protein